MQKTIVCLVLVSAFLSNVDITDQCALPFWWTQQYHFQPDIQRIGGIPKTTFRYRETIRQSDPNNYVRIQEYSEYTWWEHDTSKTKGSELSPDEMNQMSNAVFTKGGPVNGFRPRNPFDSFFTRGDSTNGMIPKGIEPKPIPSDNNFGVFPALDIANTMLNRKGETKGMFPRGETPDGKMNGGSNTFGIVPNVEVPDGVNRNGDTNGMIPGNDGFDVVVNGDTNGMIPESDIMTTSVESNGVPPTIVLPEETTVRSSDSTPEESLERERNENEAAEVIDVSKVGDLEVNDLDTSDDSKSSRLKVKEANNGPRSTFFGSWFGKKSENETGPCKVPESDIHSLRSMIEKMFSSPREHVINPGSKEKAREDIMNKFKNFGLQVWTQNFSTPMMQGVNGTEESDEGVNLIGVIPGLQRGRLDDEIVLVGAHYDTVADSNGVDDNGSGLAVMLEVARAITEARCRLNHTLMFVAFDHEENGAMGSNYFVDHYLIPEELKRARARFQGAFILDGIMNYNDIPNTQELPSDYAESLPGFQYFVNNTGNRGNFLAMISRNEMDNNLSKKLMNAWKELGDHQYKLFNLAVDMGNTIPEPSIIQKHLNFLRSDHATFWYHNSTSHFPDSLNAVLLTDTGPFRGQMKECYHSKCDDLTVITPEKLQFAKKTADALTATLVELTSATGAGNQVVPYWLIYAFHLLVVSYATKVFRNI